MKLEDFTPLFTFQTEGDVCRDTLKVEGTLWFQTVLILVQAPRTVKLFHVYEIGT